MRFPWSRTRSKGKSTPQVSPRWVPVKLQLAISVYAAALCFESTGVGGYIVGPSPFKWGNHIGRARVPTRNQVRRNFERVPFVTSPQAATSADGIWAPALQSTPSRGDTSTEHDRDQVDSICDSRRERLGWTFLKRGQAYNVVLTHIVADFDSLAAAVGVAKLWRLQDPTTPTYVVLPRGAHPVVADFLALHLELFPILGLDVLDPTGVQKIGVCDAQTRDRVGPAGELLDHAKSVDVFDHHVDRDSDITAATLHIEHVGAVTTMVTEMLREACDAAKVKLCDAEATLLALGIHADTGSLTFDSSTPRDATALAWLMSAGCQQTVVSEYTHTSLSPQQQSALVEAFGLIQKTEHNGVSVGTVLLAADERVAGMARVAQSLLEMSEVDVLLVGEMHPSKPKRPKDRMSVIGRARSRIESVDLNALFQRFGAGGHPKAAAASVRLHSAEAEDEARKIMAELVETICKDQILEPEPVAEDFMTSPVLSCQPDVTIAQAEDVLLRNRFYALPILGQGDKKDQVLGVISRAEIAKALRSGEEAVSGRPVTGFMLTKVMRVSPSTPMHAIRRDMAGSNRGGRALVVDDSGRLRGIITRTDLLRQYDFYRQIKGRGHSPPHREWIGGGTAAEPGAALSARPDGGKHLSDAVPGFLG